MKKIFTISVLSVLAVMGTASAAPDLYDGAGTETNLNLATVNYVDNAIEFAKPDTSGLVEKAQIVTSAEGQAVSVMGEEAPVSTYSLAVQTGDIEVQESMDSEVASVNTVAEHFVPSEAVQYKDDYFVDVSNEMHPGLYTIMVEVDESGNKTFIWQAVQQTRQSSSVGGQMPN